MNREIAVSDGLFQPADELCAPADFVAVARLEMYDFGIAPIGLADRGGEICKRLGQVAICSLDLVDADREVDADV